MPRNSPFVYLEAAADDAYRLLQEFEFGRLDGRIIAAGRLHFTAEMWQDLGSLGSLNYPGVDGVEYGGVWWSKRLRSGMDWHITQFFAQ